MLPPPPFLSRRFFFSNWFSCLSSLCILVFGLYRWNDLEFWVFKFALTCEAFE
uniref:Uncharacterized protein n=1 Tax=Rhizophora mucronata TaxID=61149 RepID=A0A2P2QZY6_RHIMU